MKNVTKAAGRANKISAAKKALKKWSAKDSDTGRKFIAKYTNMINELESEEKEGLFVVIGDTYKIKDQLKELGFKFSGCGTWYSETMIDADGIEVIAG